MFAFLATDDRPLDTTPCVFRVSRSATRKQRKLSSSLASEGCLNILSVQKLQCLLCSSDFLRKTKQKLVNIYDHCDYKGLQDVLTVQGPLGNVSPS
jgi:hypothetical protein